MKKLVGIGMAFTGAPALAHPGHDGLHGIVALDHPVALIGFVVFSGLVLLAASWHSKRKGRKS
jgi:hypothetical protein